MTSEQRIEFDAIILQHNNIDAAFVEFPFEVEKLFGSKGQIKIKAIFDNKVEYRGSLAKMGHHCHCLGLTKEIRKTLQKTFGDTVHVVLEQNTEPRIVTLPDDVNALMEEHPVALAYFETLSFTDKKEYIRWIESAKKTETRENRKQVFIEKLLRKKKFSDK
jgi:acetyl-CoA carboxylase beta subunit